MDKQGKPWIGAEVHLVSRILPGNEWIGEPDRIRILSGKRGRFSAKALPGREYLAWAVSQPEAGIYRSTEPVRGVVSGPIRLKERQQPQVQVRIGIGGDPHWKPPFHVKVTGAPSKLSLGDRRVGDPHEVFPLTLDKQGTVLIPLLPWPEVTVEIYDQRGVQLWAPMVSLSLDRRQAQLPAAPRATPAGTVPRESLRSLTESVLLLPEPAPRRIQITGAGGIPLPAVRLGQRIRGKFVFVTMSNAQGSLTTDLPIRTETHWDRIFELRGNSRLVLHKSGYEEIPAALPVRGLADVGNKKPKGHTIGLKKSTVKQGRVLVAPGQGLPNTQLILCVRSVGQVHQPVLLKTDAEGRFEFTQNIKAPWLLLALLDDATCRRFAGEDGVPISNRAILSSQGSNRLAGKLEVDLTQLRRVEIDMVRPDRSPASFARLDAFRFKGFNSIPPLIQMRADRRGRVALLIGDCPQALFVAQDEEGYAEINLKSIQDKTELLLAGLIRLSGVVRDKKGAPIAGARIRVDDTYISKISSGRGRNQLHALNMGFHLGHRFSGWSDASGSFSLLVPKSAEDVPVWLSRPGSQAKTQETVHVQQQSRQGVELVIR